MGKVREHEDEHMIHWMLGSIRRVVYDDLLTIASPFSISRHSDTGTEESETQGLKGTLNVYLALHIG